MSSNLPPGTANDPLAPWNGQPFDEQYFEFTDVCHDENDNQVVVHFSGWFYDYGDCVQISAWNVDKKIDPHAFYESMRNYFGDKWIFYANGPV